MESEYARLQKMYRELGDDHLLDLQQDSDDLTGDARLVLAEELKRRGLEPRAHSEAPRPALHTPVITEDEPERETGFGPGIPGIYPGGAAVMEQALEPARAHKDGKASLITLYDGIELSKACGILEENGIRPAIEAIDGDQMTGVPPRFEIWLDENAIDLAQSLLRRTMGLFPLQEVEGDGEIEEDSSGIVGQFDDRTEADQAYHLLERAGIDSELATHSSPEGVITQWELLVEPKDQERAIGVLAAGLDLR